ncbi:sigma factor-like helix-turn-helix DNA-binding protein [Streptomyces anthocyanicus]|uniref:sigma factor-like helix-turn-helix DNA-binding protein n=1 Tax=Streptomyces anthocyanicus TaxID=68174 RepID=UPI00336A993E
MLGTTTRAEDVVRDVRLRWQATDRAVVADPQAYLTTATTRLSIRAAHSARMRRASYIGPWLPEPLDTGNGGATGAEGTKPVAFDVLLMLERLDLAERAAFVLRETLSSPYAEIAAVLGVDEAQARHLVHRARRHLAADLPRTASRTGKAARTPPVRSAGATGPRTTRPHDRAGASRPSATSCLRVVPPAGSVPTWLTRTRRPGCRRGPVRTAIGCAMPGITHPH